MVRAAFNSFHGFPSLEFECSLRATIMAMTIISAITQSDLGSVLVDNETVSKISGSDL